MFFVGRIVLLLQLVEGTAFCFKSGFHRDTGEVFFCAALVEVFTQFGEPFAFAGQAVEFDAGIGEIPCGALQVCGELALFLVENEGALFFLLLFLTKLFEIGSEGRLFYFELLQASRILFEFDLQVYRDALNEFLEEAKGEPA